MKNNYDTSALVRQALYIHNAAEVLDDIDEEVHDTLKSLLEEEVEDLEDWTCDGDNFGPCDWLDEEEGWLVSFELACLGNNREENWLLAAARQQGLSLALLLTVSDEVQRHQQLRLELEAALETREEELPSVECRSIGRRSVRCLVIPLAGISLEDLAESSSDWEEVLREPLQNAVETAVQLQEAVSDLIASRIS